MEIRCRCTGCAARFKVEAKYAGKKARCPKCQAIVDVPLTNDESSASVPVQPKPAAPGSQVVLPKPGVTTTAIPVARATPTTPAPSAGSSAVAPAASSSATVSEFPAFAAKPTPSRGGSAATSATAAGGRKKSSALPLILGGGVLAIVAAAAAVGLFVANSGGGGKGGKGGGAVVANKSTLHLDWPQGERSGGSLVIDGERRAISSTGDLKFTLPPGEHKIIALRRGYEPFDATVTLAKGEEEHIAPQWKSSSVAVVPPFGSGNPTTSPNPTNVTPPSATPGSGDFPIGTAVQTSTVRGFPGWQQMLEAAKRQAAKEKKDLLVVFGCSDAQRATQELARELDQAGVTNSHICVVIDFPRTSEGLEALADRGQNEMLVEEFGVKGLPALALTDEQGRAYFLKREWDEGFGGMQGKIAEWSKSKGERDALLAAAQQGAEPERLQAAAKVVKWMQDKAVWRFYSQEIGQWMKTAERVDPENKQAVLEVFFEPQWFLNLVQINDEDTEAVVRTTGMLDPWVARKFQDHDRGAKLHLVAAQLLTSIERFDEGLKHLEHAAKYQPKDASMAREVESAKTALANRDVLGNGTGFLISADGYVLTNKHVADAPGRLEIKLPGTKETVPAQVVAKSADRDIALVKFAPPAGLPTLAIADGSVGRGKAVAAFGYPLARELGSGVKLTDGLITGLPDDSNDSMFVLSVKINPGNSGGPLCDARGNVVGMITAKTRADFFGAEDSYGLAIPAADLTAFLKEHLPQSVQLVPPAADAAPLSWDQVDEKISRGVLMIVIKKDK